MSIMQLGGRIKKGIFDFPSNVKDYQIHKKTFNKTVAKAIFKSRLFPPGKTLQYIGTIYNYLENDFPELIKKYSDKTECGTHSEKIPVWICWWQGEENFPAIVKMCVDRIRKLAPDYTTVILVTERNYKDFIDIPEYVIKKIKDGKFSITAFSDLLRVLLLSEYGGMWIDSTVYVTDQFDENYFKNPFYSPKASDSSKSIDQASERRWCGYLMAVVPHNPLFEYLRDYLLAYWAKYDKVIDYVLLDYVIMTAYKNIPHIKAMMDNRPPNNENIWGLLRSMNMPYDEKLYENLRNSNHFHKLTYKRTFVEKVNGKDTFYKMISSEI